MFCNTYWSFFVGRCATGFDIDFGAPLFVDVPFTQPLLFKLLHQMEEEKEKGPLKSLCAITQLEAIVEALPSDKEINLGVPGVQEPRGARHPSIVVKTKVLSMLPNADEGYDSGEEELVDVRSNGHASVAAMYDLQVYVSCRFDFLSPSPHPCCHSFCHPLSKKKGNEIHNQRSKANSLLVLPRNVLQGDLIVVAYQQHEASDSFEYAGKTESIRCHNTTSHHITSHHITSHHIITSKTNIW